MAPTTAIKIDLNGFYRVFNSSTGSSLFRVSQKDLPRNSPDFPRLTLVDEDFHVFLWLKSA